MSVAKVTEIIAGSSKSFEDAISNGVTRATKTLKSVQSVWIADQEIILRNDKIDEYRVRLKVTFVLK